MNTIDITLIHPIEFAGERIEVLHLRRPKGKEFRQIGNLDKPFAALLDFAAALSDLPPAAIDLLDADDVPKVMGVVGDFLGKFPEIGKTS